MYGGSDTWFLFDEYGNLLTTNPYPTFTILVILKASHTALVLVKYSSGVRMEQLRFK